MAKLKPMSGQVLLKMEEIQGSIWSTANNAHYIVVDSGGYLDLPTDSEVVLKNQGDVVVTDYGLLTSINNVLGVIYE